MNIEFTPRNVIDTMFAEAALYGFLYYAQMLLKVEGNLWISTAILWALLNAIVIFSPVVKKCYKQ